MSIRKVKMATAILIVFNTPERGHSNGVFEKQQFLHSQKLRTVVGQKYHHPGWVVLLAAPRPNDTLRVSYSKAVISLSVCTCTHVRTSTFFGFFVHVCRYAKFCFSAGSLFCLLVHIKHVFLRMYTCVH